MVAEDILHLDTSRNQTALGMLLSVKTSDTDCQTASSKVEDGIFAMDDLVEADNENHEKPSGLPLGDNMNLAVDLSQIDLTQSKVDGINELLADGKDKADGVSSLSSKKRPRMDEEPSVRIIYSSLTRNSKRKLEELLNLWSEWHTQNCSSVQNLTEESSEFGEETYYPALHVAEKRSTVSFCLDNQVWKRQCKESLSLKNECVPVYDRDYSLGLTPDEESPDPNIILNAREASRCFNCSSYSHALKDCPKPHNTVSISNARKEFQSKRNMHSAPRVHTRYFQSSPSGKYDGLKPGCLAAETREALGLGELDPPPWLHRMRQLGYPPGYLDPEDEDPPSGLSIYGEKDTGNALTNNIKSNSTRPRTKMSVDFPGINALVPKNADQTKWHPLQEQVDAKDSFPRSPSINNLYQSTDAIVNSLSWPQNYAGAPSPRHGHWSSLSMPGHPVNHYDSWSSPPVPFHHINHYDSSPTYSDRYLSPMSISIPTPRDSWRPPPYAGMPFSPLSRYLPNSEPSPPGAEPIRRPWPPFVSGISYPSL